MSRSKKSDRFNSPTKGEINFNTLVSELLTFMNKSPEDQYRLTIGTSSQVSLDSYAVDFVTAIVIYRVGKGARYFWQRNKSKDKDTNPLTYPYALIKQEVSLSLEIAQKLRGNHELIDKIDDKLKINIDIEQRESTGAIIREITGTLKDPACNIITEGGGYATKVADKHKKTLIDSSDLFCRRCGTRQNLTKHHYFRKIFRKKKKWLSSKAVQNLCQLCQTTPKELAKLVVLLCQDCHREIEQMIDGCRLAAGRKKLSVDHYMLLNLMFLGIYEKKNKRRKR